jgi:crotonobetainyl-CoA:carnitine CoA-transferase CaiB-like acyl-CoA transferase
MGGSYGVIGILAALYEREKTGKGQYVIATLFESVALLVGQHMTYSVLKGEPAPPMPARLSAWAIYDLFESKEGERVFVGITSDMQWKRFCDTFGLPSLYADERLSTNNSRISQREWMIPELQKVFKEIEKAEIVRLCEEASIPFAPIAKPEDLFDDPQLNEGGSLVETTLPGGIKAKLPRIPVRIGSYDFGLRCNPPEVGEGSQELLRSIGISEREIHDLKRSGVLAFSS